MRSHAQMVDERTRTAFHEAGHAVLSAALAEPPAYVTIRSDGRTLGRSRARMSAEATCRAQVHLAGFAAEHLRVGRRPRQLDQELGLALVARRDAVLRGAFAGCQDHDGYRAVEDVLRGAVFEDDEELRREVDRLYAIARESLSAAWTSVKRVAEALLARGELDRQAFDAAVDDADLCTPVLAVQRAHGLLR